MILTFAKWALRGDANVRIGSLAAVYWKVMSTHFEMSDPSPEEMVMQPRTFCLLLSLTQIE